MSTTLANLRTELRLELRDPDGVTFQDADIDYAINQAYFKIYAAIAKVNEDFFVTTANVNIVSGTRSYSLPSDHLKTKKLEFVDGSVQIPLKRYKRGYGLNYTGGVSFNTVSSYPDYDFEGITFVLEPTPLISLTSGLKHTYYQTATKLVSSTDTINSNYKDMWSSGVTLDAAFNCLNMIEARGGRVSSDIKQRRDEVWEAIIATARMRTLSPIRLRRKGYFR